MSREWKPGDVAMLAERGVAVVDRKGRFVYGVGDYANALPGSISAKAARPLVVIDLEDREQVERLDSAIRSTFGGPGANHCDNTELLRAALREFANPTPPPCRATVNVRINTNYIAASCAEPSGHEGSHRSDNGTSWDATEVAP